MEALDKIRVELHIIVCKHQQRLPRLPRSEVTLQRRAAVLVALVVDLQPARHPVSLTELARRRVAAAVHDGDFGGPMGLRGEAVEAELERIGAAEGGNHHGDAGLVGM